MEVTARATIRLTDAQWRIIRQLVRDDIERLDVLSTVAVESESNPIAGPIRRDIEDRCGILAELVKLPLDESV